MKKLLLLLLLLSFAVSLRADSNSPAWTSQYDKYGKLILVKLDTAPFPHPDRAHGHIYNQTNYSTEKSYSNNTVGIFVPKGFRQADKVDFVVYFYGWRHHIENTLSTYHLAEQFVDSGRNAILIIPTGPYDAPDSFEGKLEDENGFKRFMADVMATLRRNEIIRTEPVGSIILSAHSGGFEPVSSILAVGGMNDNIKEVWLFDALYGRTEKFMKWFDNYPGRRMVNLYTADGGTRKETEKLIAATKTRKPPVSYVAKNESEITPRDLAKNQLVFIFTATEHDHTPYEHQSYRKFLETSRLSPIKFYPSPKMSRP